MTNNRIWCSYPTCMMQQSSSSFKVRRPYPLATKSLTTFTLFIPYLLAIIPPSTIQLPPFVSLPMSLRHGPATAKQALLGLEYSRGTLSRNIDIISSIDENSLFVYFEFDRITLRFLHGLPISTSDNLVYVPPTSAANTVLIELGFVLKIPVPAIDVMQCNCKEPAMHMATT